MVDTLVEHPWLTTAALLGLIVLGPFVGAWLARRPRIANALLTPAGVVVVLFTLLPTGRDVSAGCVAAWQLPTPGRVELMANVVMFVPVVLVAGVLIGRPLVVLAVASVGSALIELVQAVLPILGRSCSTTDWLCNTMGAVVGAALAATALRLARPSAT